VVKELVGRYKAQLNQQVPGKRFDEVYDVTTIRPKSDWLATYEEVKTELRGLGIPF